MSKSSKHTTDLDLKDLLSSFMTDISTKMADMSTKIDSLSAKLDSTNADLGSLRDELKSNVATIHTRIDNIQEESESKFTLAYVEAPKQSSHTADAIAQISWFRQSILRKTKLATSSPTSPFPTVLAISTVKAITPGKATSTAHLVAGIIQFLPATFPVLSLRLLCSRPLPWPIISPFLQTPWRPPWHFFYSFPQI